MHNDMEIQSISETNDGSTLEEGVWKRHFTSTRWARPRDRCDLVESSLHFDGGVGDMHNLQVRPDMERLDSCNPSESWVVVQAVVEEVRSLVAGTDQADCTEHEFVV